LCQVISALNDLSDHSWARWARWALCLSYSLWSLLIQAIRAITSRLWLLNDYLIIALFNHLQESSNTRSSFKIFILKITFLLYLFIAQQNFLSEHAVMHSCKHCSHLQKKCHVNNKFDRCIKCMHLDHKCNLTFSMMKWKRIKTEHDRVLHKLLNTHKQMKEIFTRTTHLQNQFMFLKNKKQMMIKWKFWNIIELEKEETKISESSLNNLLFDVFFKQIEISSNFDWLSFLTETITEASDSSWDFFLIFKCSWYVHNLFTWLINETDLQYSVDLVYFLLCTQRSDSLIQFLKILFELMNLSLQTSKEKYEILSVFS